MLKKNWMALFPLFISFGCTPLLLGANEEEAPKAPISEMEVNETKEEEPILEGIAAVVNDWIIFEANLQLETKILQNAASGPKQKSAEFREEALKNLIKQSLVLQTYRMEIKHNLETRMEEGMGSQEDREFLANLKRVNSSTGFAHLIYSMHPEAQEELLRRKVEWERECQKHGYDLELYSNQAICADVAQLWMDQEVKRHQANKVILENQLNKEVEVVVRNSLINGLFYFEVLTHRLPTKKKLTEDQLNELRNQFAKFSALSSAQSQPLQFFLDQAKQLGQLSGRLPQLDRLSSTWADLPYEIKKEIKDFTTPKLFEVIQSEDKLQLFRLDHIELEKVKQEVDKYQIRILFKQSSPLENDAILRRRMNLWAQEIREGRESFEALAKAHSDHFETASDGGLIQWKSLDEIQLDPKLRHAITQLGPERRLSRPIKSGEGWYLIEWLDKKVESVDPRTTESLKTQARKQIQARAASEFLKKRLEALERQSTIQKFNFSKLVK